MREQVQQGDRWGDGNVEIDVRLKKGPLEACLGGRAGRGGRRFWGQLRLCVAVLEWRKRLSGLMW